MIRLAHTEFLYALLVLLPLAGIYVYGAARRKKMMGRLGEPALLASLVRSPGKYKRPVKFFLISAAAAFLITGLANPQIGTKLEEVKREGVDAMIVLDVSNSMKAEDIKPSRLDHAKQNISRMLDRLGNDRVGLIVFAGQSYLQLPLTTDYPAVRLVLNTIDTDAVPVPGTAIGSAIRLAMESFIAGETKHKVIILVTDGENHEDDALAGTEKARKEGVVIHTIGMGSPEGSPIPVYSGGSLTGFKKDAAGSVVISKLNEDMLKQIADEGGGVYVRATNQQNEFDEIFRRISSMEKKEFGSKIFTDYEDRFQYFIAMALLFLLAEFFLSERGSGWAPAAKLFSVKP
ncbi:MAG TPA: VWA domain-containing protein [Bacteroidota bacterium]|nr:VWA domain-containing protein [Bacteroidota bacterium]